MSVYPSVSRITDGLRAGLLAAALLTTACSSEPAANEHAAGASGAGGTSATGGAGGNSGGSVSGGSAGQAQLCGNGQVDPGETCDESALQGGSGTGGSGTGGSGTGGSGTGGSGTGGSGAGGGGTGGGGVGGTGGSTEGSGAGGSGTGDSGTGGGGVGGTGGSTGGSGTGSGTGGSGTGGSGAEVGRCISLAACPPASSACMRPVLTGSSATCDVACAEVPVSCTHGDGCCAPGCTPNEDDDCAVWSCDPSAPLGGAAYADMEALSKDALRSALNGFVSGHTALGYDSARDYMFNTLDVHDGDLECIYTGRLVQPDGTRIPGGFNTEHSWPQSLGANKAPANSDLHHLFPSDGIANGARANWPFGETLCEAAACEYFKGGSELGKDAQGQTVFQVRTLRQGDIARAHFYFSIRYNMPIGATEEAVLRQWHCADPPDALERARNDAIETMQHNRNPFVDRPDFAQRLLDF